MGERKAYARGCWRAWGAALLGAAALGTLSAWGARAGDSPESPISESERQFWSFRLLDQPPVPQPRGADKVRNPVDAFLLEQLETAGFTFSPEADRATLLRRVYLDLVGLPPSPQEQEAFAADTAADAYERLVDRLLASPHFGERWGRHWLDLAGYVDTVGFDTDATNILLAEGKWRYRDWVIAALNDDKSYNRFIVEQLAGDELYDWRRAPRLTPAMRDALVATGYLRTARDLTHEDVGLIQQNYYGIMHDTLDIMGTSLLGLTLGCARCHSHKFDPIPHEDYYRLMATLAPAYNPDAWRAVLPFDPKVPDRTLPDISPAEVAEATAFNRELDERTGRLRGQLAELTGPARKRLADARLATLPEVIRADVKAAVETPADKRGEVAKYLAAKFAKTLEVKPDEARAALDGDGARRAAELEAEIAACQSRRPKWGKIQALFDVGTAPAMHVLLRGSEQSKGPAVVPGFLRVLSANEAAAAPPIVAPVEGTSGRRLALARWLTAPDTPASALVARVEVNRLWQHVFGRGLVPTSDNFGVQGQPPTHPELLEWLAAQFVADGWHVKPTIKRLVMSAAYRQASHERGQQSDEATDPAKADPDNDLLWRMRLRRLESEVIRDSMLAASGRLNRAMGGPSVMINSRPDGMVVVARDKLADPSQAFRRSVYLVSRRAYNVSLLTVFDQPLVATNCARRDASAVPMQSLVMLNDAEVAEAAGELARRIERLAPASRDVAIDSAFRLALAREPNAAERAACLELLDNERAVARQW